jgi:Ca2+-binding EF-hand superfamily protein
VEWEHFLATDVDRNGEVSASELQSMLGAAGLVFSLQTVMKLITLHSPRDRGTLDFAEFTNIQGFLRNIQASFQYFDSSRTGRLSKSEVLRALHHAGFGHVDEGAVKSACQAFDPDRTNGLSLDQYIAMTLFLLAAKRAFDAFAASSATPGRITLDFNQFVYAASKTR